MCWLFVTIATIRLSSVLIWERAGKVVCDLRETLFSSWDEKQQLWLQQFVLLTLHVTGMDSPWLLLLLFSLSYHSFMLPTTDSVLCILRKESNNTSMASLVLTLT